MADPDSHKERGRSSRPWDKGGPGLRKKFFRPFGSQFGLKMTRVAGPPGPLPCICHWSRRQSLRSAGSRSSKLLRGHEKNTQDKFQSRIQLMLIAWTESIRYKIILFASQPSYHFTYMRCKDVLGVWLLGKGTNSIILTLFVLFLNVWKLKQFIYLFILFKAKTTNEGF